MMRRNGGATHHRISRLDQLEVDPTRTCFRAYKGSPISDNVHLSAQKAPLLDTPKVNFLGDSEVVFNPFGGRELVAEFFFEIRKICPLNRLPPSAT